MSELKDFFLELVFTHRFDGESVVRPLYEMDVAYRYATTAYFKHRHQRFLVLYLKVSYTAYSPGFPYANISDKHNAVLSPQNEVCGTIEFITERFQSLHKYVFDLRPCPKLFYVLKCFLCLPKKLLVGVSELWLLRNPPNPSSGFSESPRFLRAYGFQYGGKLFR